MNNAFEQEYLDFGTSDFLSFTLSFLIIITSLFFYGKVQSYKIQFLLIINIFWSFLIIFNRLKLSNLQISWEWHEQILMSLVFFLPTIILFFLSGLVQRRNLLLISETFEDPMQNIRFDALLKLVSFLTYLSFSILLLDLFLNGVPIFDFSLGSVILNESRTNYRIPIFYSMSHQMLLLMAAILSIVQYKFNPAKKVLIILLILYSIHSVLMVARGSLIYMLSIVFIAYFIFSQSSYLRKITLSLIPVFSILIGFSIIGALRSSVTEGGFIDEFSFSIQNYGGFSENLPSPLAWAYGYGVINFDSLIICIREHANLGDSSFKTLQNFSPALLSFFTEEQSETVVESSVLFQTLPYIGRFNLVTAFGALGYDYGWIGIYVFSSILIFSVPIIFNKNFNELSLTRKSLFLYFSMTFLFITITNAIISSRFILFVFCLIVFSLMCKITKVYETKQS